jgi:hypothetical protein
MMKKISIKLYLDDQERDSIAITAKMAGMTTHAYLAVCMKIGHARIVADIEHSNKKVQPEEIIHE